MKKVILLLVVFCISAAVHANPAAALHAARGAENPAEAVRILERALPSAGDLRPWYLYELARFSAQRDDWRSVLNWSSFQIPSRVPAELADRVVQFHAEALIRTGQPQRGFDMVKARLDATPDCDPVLYTLAMRAALHPQVPATAAEDVIVLMDLLDVQYPSLRIEKPGLFYRSRYLGALASSRLNRWTETRDLLSVYIPQIEQQTADSAPWARYFLAYSHYRLGAWADAVQHFRIYLTRWPTHPWAWQSASTASMAASLGGLDPLPFAEQAVRSAPGRTELAESLILKASILMDKKDFDGAELILISVADGSGTSGATSVAPRAHYLLAELFLRAGVFPGAEDWWLTLIRRYPDHALSDEALFRLGELQYVAGDWRRATEFFGRYRRTLSRGRYLEQVLWSGGDTYNRSGATDLAILWWEDLIRQFPQGTMTVRAYEELIRAYRKGRDWNGALRIAHAFQAAFPREAETADIARELDELRRLAAGESVDAASLQIEWTRAGKAGTAGGRSTGVQLARAYLEDFTRRPEALAVLREITGRMPERTHLLPDAEKYTWAMAWMLQGNILREDRIYRDAARALLASGTLFASLDGERAAEALYGAADSFLQAGLQADARSAADTILKTWPDSPWSRRVRLLLE